MNHTTDEKAADDFTEITSFPDNFNDIWKLDKPLHWETFLKSDVLANGRYDVKLSTTITRTSACISVIASALLIAHILRSHQGLSTTYHRLVFGISFSDIVFSFAIALGTVMVPKDLDYWISGVRGNTGTCTAQGFLVTVGMVSSVWYNCSICFYYLAIIRYNKTDTYIKKKLEPWLHGIPVLYPLLSAFTLIAIEGFNTYGAFCFAGPHNPPHCIGYENGHVVEGFEIPCYRGDNFYRSVIVPISIINISIPPTIIIISNVLMFRTVAKIEQRVQRYGVSNLRLRAQQQEQGQNGDKKNTDESTLGEALRKAIKKWVSCLLPCHCNNAGVNSRSNRMKSQKRAVLHMASGYSLAWALVWIPSTSLFIIGFSSRPAIIISAFMIPLQGLFTFIVFILPKVRNTKKPRRGYSALSWYEAFIKAYISRGEKRRTVGPGSLGSKHRSSSSILKRVSSSLKKIFLSHRNRGLSTSINSTGVDNQHGLLTKTNSNNAASNQA